MEWFRSCLGQAGYEITDSAYHESAFGSWLLVVASDPASRVIWDGKDQWLVVQRLGSDSEWQDSWVGKTEDQQTLDRVLAILRSS
jgi:hypothetical protein